VSLTGVTGAADAPPTWLTDASLAAGALGRSTDLPVVVGFGIDTPEKARLAAAHADGVVVGTALVRIIEEAASSEARAAGVTALVGDLRRALSRDAR
jgi:tryptophan synthase alpha chain